MASCDLSIRLEDDRADFLGGDTVRGEVEVRTDGDITCNGLVAECLWQTHGKGNTDRGEPISVELFQGEWPSGTVARYPFAVQLPHGPFTYHGELLNVGWLVRARADVPWKLDPKAERDLTLRPSPDAEPQPLQAIARPELLPTDVRRRLGEPEQEAGAAAEVSTKAKVAGIGCVALFLLPFLAFAVTGVWKVVGVIRGTQSLADVIPWMVFILFGLGIVAVVGARFLRNKVAAKKLGDVVFEVEPVVLRRGDAVRVRAFCQPHEKAELKRAVLRLEAEEKVVRGSGTNKTTYRHQIHAEEVELATGRQLSAGLPFHLEHSLTLPANAPPSFHASDNQLRWTVSLHFDIARWPDWQDDRALIVHL